MKNPKRKVILILLIVFLLFAVRSALWFFLKDYYYAYQKVEVKESSLPFRTITSEGQNPKLIPYEYYQQKDEGSIYTECNAIIKLTNPDLDDYKSICRLIISDVRKSVGNDEIKLHIFDDFQSYVLSAIDYSMHYKVLSTSETDSVKKHTVAVYYGNIFGNDNSHSIHYFPELRSFRTENEVFYP